MYRGRTSCTRVCTPAHKGHCREMCQNYSQVFLFRALAMEHATKRVGNFPLGGWWDGTHLCWHCSAMGPIRCSMLATSTRPNQCPVLGRGTEGGLTVGFLDLAGRPLRCRPIKCLKVVNSSRHALHTGRTGILTHPFSITKLNARTISSIGTSRRCQFGLWQRLREAHRCCRVGAQRSRRHSRAAGAGDSPSCPR